ncbi:hypothetical protein JOE52_007204 [Bradyrhizobium canariense]|nr:hypothetical protein [Bradyrhizobium canariense]
MRRKPRGVAKGALTWRWPFAEDADPLWSAMQRRELSERALADSQPGGRPLVGEDWWDMQTFVRRARGADPMSSSAPKLGAPSGSREEPAARSPFSPTRLDLF